MWSLFTLVYPCLSLFLVQTKKHHHHVAKAKTECQINFEQVMSSIAPSIKTRMSHLWRRNLLLHLSKMIFHEELIILSMAMQQDPIHWRYLP